MLEIEKMMMMREAVALDSDRERISDAMEALGAAFKQMLMGTRDFMLNDELPGEDLTQLHAHMDVLHEIGARFGIDFAPTGTDAELRSFVLKFGMEVVQHG